MRTLQWISISMLVLIASVLLLVHGCGAPPDGAGTMQGRDAIPIYQAIFDYHTQQGSGSLPGLYHETMNDILGEPFRQDCPQAALLQQQMPALDSDLITMFCRNSVLVQPISPDIFRALMLKPIEGGDIPSTSFLRTSIIQGDPMLGQALVFVEVRDGDFVRGAYLLLHHDSTRWIVQDEIEMYIS